MTGQRFRVLIATTDGPAAVQKITPEDAGVPSVACLDGTTEVLGISSDYARFVNRGTGLVASETGHEAYRLDLDGHVHGGLSWQLPVLLAHRLASQGRLADPDDESAPAVLATGIVDRDQRVRPVEAISEKIASARDRIAGIVSTGADVLVVLPATDETDGAEAILAEFGDAVSLLRWDRMDALPESRSVDGGAVEERVPSPTMTQAPPSRSLRPWPAWLAGALVVVIAGAAWWLGPHRWEPMRRDGDFAGLDLAMRSSIPPLAALYRLYLESRATPLQDIAIDVVEHRTADGGSCAGRRFRGTGLKSASLAEQRPGLFRSEGDRSLCSLTYTLTNRGDQLFYAYLGILPVGAASGLHQPNAAGLPPNSSLSLELDPRELASRQTGVVVLALASPGPSPDLRRTLERAGSDGPSSADGDDTLSLARLPGLGIPVKSASHSIIRTPSP